jgi:hypothetical protein
MPSTPSRWLKARIKVPGMFGAQRLAATAAGLLVRLATGWLEGSGIGLGMGKPARSNSMCNRLVRPPIAIKPMPLAGQGMPNLIK